MSQIREVLALAAKFSSSLNKLEQSFLERHKQALETFCTSAENEVSTMRLLSGITLASGLLSGAAGAGAACTTQMLQELLKAAHTALPLLGQGAQTFTQTWVVKAQTEKTLAERTQLNGADQGLQRVEESRRKAQDATARVQEAWARARG